MKVFISYSHDSREHARTVLDLSDRLRKGGVDCYIDQYEESPREGWSRWMMNQIEQAEFVLVVCTETYERRFRGKEEAGKGLGARWEGAIITEEIYQNEANNTKFIPLVFSVADSAHIPVMLRSATYYDLGSEEGYEKLYRRLTKQPEITPPSLGKIIPMPPGQPYERDAVPATHELAASHIAPMPPLKRKQDFRASHELQRLSARLYALIALVGLAIGIGLLVFYVYRVPKLELGVRNEVHYVVLFASALACSVAFFAAMRSYMRFQGKHIGLILELGAAAALVCLIAYGGSKLVPLQPVTHLTGSIVPPPPNWKELRVTIEGQTSEGRVDELGRFGLDVNRKDGERVRLMIYAGQEIVKDDFYVLPGPITLKLDPPR